MARSRSGMPRSIHVGVPSGWFSCDVAHGADGRPGHRQNRRTGALTEIVGARALPSAHAVPLTYSPAPRPARSPDAWSDGPCWPTLSRSTRSTPCLFADTGLSDAEISVLFALWSAVGIVAEVPSGALADRFGRRTSLAAGALLQAVGFATWTLFPGLLGFAAGLRGVGAGQRARLGCTGGVAARRAGRGGRGRALRAGTGLGGAAGWWRRCRPPAAAVLFSSAAIRRPAGSASRRASAPPCWPPACRSRRRAAGDLSRSPCRP